MGLALQVLGELVAMATGTGCQCSEEGSSWLLGCCRAAEMGHSDKRVPEPPGT